MPSGAMRESKDCFYYIPLLSSLQAMLNCKDVSEQVSAYNYCVQINIILFQIFKSHQLESGKIGDYCDSEQFKNHPLFKKYRHSLQICLYYDDLETCNPLGSKAKIHKLSKCIYNIYVIIVPNYV